MSLSWEAIAEAKRTALLESIPQEWRIPDSLKPPADQLNVTDWSEKSGWFTEAELEITNKTASGILDRLRTGQWTSLEVTKAFCKRAAAAHQLTNCLSETMYESALHAAQKVDEYFQQNDRQLIGPLHGLPISIKDNFFVSGKDSTLGFVSLANKPAERDSPLVEILKAAGAIIYVKTNVPTAMMIAETTNNLFGRTLNPLNRKLTSGGSSGGESALIAFRGSPLGVGSDIGGSLRIPAACTGIFTLRPSFGRFPTIFTQSGLAGQEAVQSVNGPMARDIRDLEIYCKALIDAEPWKHDPRCIPLPWRKTLQPVKLKVGVLWNDGVVTPTPPVTRALEHLVEKMKSNGHEVIDWEPTGHSDGVSILGRMFLADGGKSVKKLLEPVGEPLRPEMQVYGVAKELGVYDMWQLHRERLEFCKAYLDRWNACNLDAILCPTTPYSSVEHGDFKYVGYTGVFNILDYSAVSFPTGLMADHQLDAKYASEESLSQEDTSIRATYNPKAVHGMPISLQLVSRRLEEEHLLYMTSLIAELCGS